MCHRRGDLAGSEKICADILAASPGHFGALHMMGALQTRKGRPQDSLSFLQTALGIDPRSVPVLSCYADALTALGRWDEALSHYDRALKLVHNDSIVLNQRGIVLRRLGRTQEAIQSFSRALAVRPDYAAALNNRATALQDLHRFEEAVADCDKALAANRNNVQAWNNRGLALLKLDKPQDAVASFQAGLAIRPDHAEMLANCGVALRELNQQPEAISYFKRSIASDPDHANARWNLGISSLLLGDFEEGLTLYEWRKKLVPPVEAREYAKPLWTGEQDIAGKTLFLYVEQGLGDAIQFYRLVSPLLARGARVILSVHDRLLRLFESASPKVELVGSQEVPAFDYHLPLMSVPLALGLSLGTIPAPTPYLAAEDERVAYWRDRIGRDGFKIGISWQGAPGGVGSRAMPLSCFESLARIPGVRLISLQKGLGTEQVASFPWVESLGEQFDAGPDAFVDSAAVIKNLDLIITLDSALAHLAGALNCPVWVALKQVPDWRWLLDRDDSPWYPSMRLFRQRCRDNWLDVFTEMQSLVPR